MTLDAARIDLRKAFVEGMGYVALSRVKNLRSLYLSGINRMALEVSKDAQTIDVSLRKKSVVDPKKLVHYKNLAIKRKEELTKKPVKKSNSWSAKIAKMRETYPNAYRPWESKQDDMLKEKFQNGASIGELSKLLGRHEGSISMRLKKHFGEDIGIMT